MKKKTKIILIIAILAILIGTIIWLIPKKNINYVIIYDGYVDYESQIISNYQDFIEFINYMGLRGHIRETDIENLNINKYNKQYFKNKSLAIVNIYTGSSMDKFERAEISIIGNILFCKSCINYTNEMLVTTDINSKLLLVETNKLVKHVFVI